MSTFPQDYTPSTGGTGDYTKLQDGSNRLRVVYDQLLIGWQYWDTNNKCHRFAFNAKPANTPNIKDGEKLKEFFALGVYNYESKRLEVWEVTQATLKGPLVDYTRNEDYGPLTRYGLTVKKTGSGLKTEYSVVAGIPKPLPAEIQAMVDAQPLNLQALLTGDNPFDNHPAPGQSAPQPARSAQPARTQPALAGGEPGDDDNDLPF